MKLITLIFILSIIWISGVYAETGTASWYSVESCWREGTSGIMANGRRLIDENYTCAMWDVPFGTRVLVRNLDTGASVVVVVADRGPAKRLVARGRIIDLSKVSFEKICPLWKGLCKVSVEVLP